MLKLLIAGVAVVVVLAVITFVFALAQPDRFEVRRSTDIKAPAEAIFPLINNLHAFNTWNPFDKRDPNIKGTYAGPDSGNGASYSFESSKSGTGSVEIVEAMPSSKVIMRLTMIKPIAADNRVAFTLEPEGDTTRVTWAMDGGVPFAGKIIHLVFNMDKMVGRDFEAGLADLKALAEKSSPSSY
ncbi:MAG: SRPBCC family protein [Bradyrhizobiaceae bacterium]|nr:SRPBCC family protein [Bradyrhizobiaceae bacterium]